VNMGTIARNKTPLDVAESHKHGNNSTDREEMRRTGASPRNKTNPTQQDVSPLKQK